MADQTSKTSEVKETQAAAEADDVARTLAEIALRSDRIVKTHLAHQAKKLHEEHPDEIGVSKAFADLATRMMSDPYKLAETGMKMWQSQFELWQSWVKQVTGAEPNSPAPEQKSDPRFIQRFVE